MERGMLGVGLTTRKGTRACAAESVGGDGTDGGSVDDGGAMSAAYSGCVGVGSGRGNEEGGGLSGASEGRKNGTGGESRTGGRSGERGRGPRGDARRTSKVGEEVGDAYVSNGIGRVLLCQVLQVMQCPDDVFELLYLLFVCEGWSGRYE